ncbi:hypothetical protein FACS1894113_5450 [Alphaproteobacteria bacterium]|nr:hypothetical protein FACS1894113_5450 [Alphaproteobacteria bacterium]
MSLSITWILKETLIMVLLRKDEWFRDILTNKYFYESGEN